jgi:hypothetical protein
MSDQAVDAMAAALCEELGTDRLLDSDREILRASYLLTCEGHNAEAADVTALLIRHIRLSDAIYSLSPSD